MPRIDAAGKVCSFCGRPWTRGERFAGGFGAMICRNCLDKYHQLLSSHSRTLAISTAPWETMTDEELLEVLPAIALTAEQVQEFLSQWISLMRDRKISWERIGRALSISRQAAWERFSR